MHTQHHTSQHKQRRSFLPRPDDTTLSTIGRTIFPCPLIHTRAPCTPFFLLLSGYYEAPSFFLLNFMHHRTILTHVAEVRDGESGTAVPERLIIAAAG